MLDDDLACFENHSGVAEEFCAPVRAGMGDILEKMGLALEDLGRAYHYFLTRPGETTGGFMWAIAEDL